LNKKAKLIRLDQWLAKAAGLTRSAAKKVIQQQRVKQLHQDGKLTALMDPKFKIATDATIIFDDKSISIQASRYLLLYKPAGYICSTQDEVYPSALKLVDSIQDKSQLHFAGRLDVDTTGLVLISDDGQWTHRVTSPRKNCTKTYRVSCAQIILSEQIKCLEQGVKLKGDEKTTLPSVVEVLNPKQINLTINEGRYHQVKRMLAAVGNHVEKLHRQQISQLSLAGLNEGEWRHLTAEEVALFD
jgi:16S rRNA pseudouridine516 synthase